MINGKYREKDMEKMIQFYSQAIESLFHVDKATCKAFRLKDPENYRIIKNNLRNIG